MKPTLPTNPDKTDLKAFLPKMVVASVKLPSRGFFYPSNVTKDECVEIKPLTAKDEKLIAGLRGDNAEEVISLLLNRCLINPNATMDTEDFLSSDRFFLLLLLRANSFGEDYNVDLKCDSCGKEAQYNLKIPRDFKIEYSQDGAKEPFQVQLPSGINISYRLLRARDEKEIRRYVEMAAKNIKGKIMEDLGLIYRLAKSIVSVNNVEANITEVQNFLEELPIKDSRFLQSHINKNTPGLISNTEKECKFCGSVINTGLPLNAEFFRPQY